MGLDITACKGATLVKASQSGGWTDEDWKLMDRGELECVYGDDFPERLDGLEPGFYAVEDRFGFRAGSYGGYNAWREQLSRLGVGVEPGAVWADRAAYRGKPFYELVDFADNEGTIGPKTSAKLEQDFITHREQAQAYAEDAGTRFFELYELWSKAFALAAQNGMVVFH